MIEILLTALTGISLCIAFLLWLIANSLESLIDKIDAARRSAEVDAMNRRQAMEDSE